MSSDSGANKRPLGENLVLKSLGMKTHAQKLTAFNTMLHGEGAGAMVKSLIRHHPHIRPDNWLFIEDEGNDKVVSSLCLIPWTWRYQDVVLRAGEMGFVGTLEAYRNRGLQRALAGRFAERLRENGYDLSHIQGIPYFYRRFGYEYAIPLLNDLRVELHTVPDVPKETFTFRNATAKDIPILKRLYNEAMDNLDLYAVRDEAVWRYLFKEAMKTETAADTWLVHDASRKTAGYFRVARKAFFTEGLSVTETSRLSNDAAAAALRRLKKLAVERGKPYVRLEVPSSTTLAHAARDIGGLHHGNYAWQVRLVDVAAFLKKLAPVFERRLADSSLAGLTRDVCLNLYREAFLLRFKKGKLRSVQSLGFSDEGDLRIPPHLLTPLVLGYRSVDELSAVYHDLRCFGLERRLADILFQKTDAILYTFY